MARLFRIWEKKRGDRRTGSPLLGSLGEALFFGVLLVLGLISFVVLLTSQVVEPGTNRWAPGFGFWLMSLVLTSFILIGGSGLIFTMFRVGTSAERRSVIARRAAGIELLSDAMPAPKGFPTLPSDADLTNSPGIKFAYRLPSSQSPLWQLSAAAIFCIVWNGVAAVLLLVAVKSPLATWADWLLPLTIVPFLVVGGWSIRHLFRQMMLYTGIGPTIVEISDHPLLPGIPYKVFVSQSGRLTMNTLEMFLVCAEEATYHQGTDIRNDVCVVHEQLVFRREKFAIDPGVPFQYQCTFSVPEGTMHSFQSAHNRVTWKLVVKGDAASWPVFVRSFPVVVYPASASLSPTADAEPVTQVKA